MLIYLDEKEAKQVVKLCKKLGKKIEPLLIEDVEDDDES